MTTVAYTWAAVKALQLFSVKPTNSKACIQYLLSLRNEDGGFGSRLGFHSTPMSTYYAIDALNSLDALSALDNAPKPNVYSKKSKKLTSRVTKYILYRLRHKVPAARLKLLCWQKVLKIDLWGSKNAGAGWIESAQKIANEKKVPVTFFQADEPYGKNVHIDGLGTFGHILDYMAPAGIGFVPFKVNTTVENFRKSAIAIKDSSSWKDFRTVAIDPLLKVNGGLILQVANNEVMARDCTG